MNPSASDECVLEIVAMIPPGALCSYGDVAALLAECGVACTARQVARCLSRFGAQVPWWRVVQSGGTIAEQVRVDARGRLAAEGVLTDGRRVDLAGRRWHPVPEEVKDALDRSGVL